MKSIIFDMDGVIFDSEKAVYEGWQRLALKYGFTNLEIPYMKCIGVNAQACEEIFLEFYGPEFPYKKYKEEQRQDYHKRYDGGKLPLKPQIEELLIYLKEAGYKIAIASSTRTETVVQQITDAGLIDYFEVIVGGDQVKKSKPDPQIFLEAARLLKADAKSTYVIEDSFNGIRAAYNGGMIPIMVPDMIPADDEMKKKAKYICKDLNEVKELIL